MSATVNLVNDMMRPRAASSNRRERATRHALREALERVAGVALGRVALVVLIRVVLLGGVLVVVRAEPR